ncbi:hypothetical protein [Lelliottia nimipressuralis]|jgi:hypothetical protein
MVRNWNVLGCGVSSERPGSGWIDIRLGQQGAKHRTTKAFQRFRPSSGKVVGFLLKKPR